jgi:2-ketocyclohexanecarboxyl-CoA hydrolase
MKYVDIIYEKEDGVAWITVNRPQVYNAIRARTSAEMDDALLDAGRDNSVRAVVISGAGPNAFGAGQDQSFDNPDPRDEVGHTVRDPSFGGQVVPGGSLIRRIPQPVIAMVDGFCIGASHIMAYNCDFTIASDRSIFGQAGPRVGSPAAGHGVAYLASLVGQKKAREIWYLTRQYSAQEALQMGLINAVVPADQLKAEVKRWCEDIKRNSPIIIQMEKMGFNEYGDLIRPEASPFQRHLEGSYSASDESVERRRAFLERRPVDQSKNLPYADTGVGGA